MTRAQEIADLLSGVTISTADNNPQLTLESTDADANFGPVLKMHRNSSSPADSDFLGEIQFQGENDAGEAITYAQMFGRTVDVGDGTEDGRIATKIMIAGTAQNVLDIKSNEIVINDDSVDLDFRVEGNGNANLLFVDAGNDRIGIGVSTPAAVVDIKSSGATSTALRVLKSSAAQNLYAMTEISGHGRVSIYDGSENEDIRLDTNGVSYFNGGNVLVGKTSASVTTVGAELRQDGAIIGVRDGDLVALLNRTSSDGDVIDIRKDNTTVGTIGTNGDRLYFTTANKGFYVDESGSEIVPSNGSGSNTNNVMNLGNSASAFKDLYLGGNLYIGGTGSANALDDYEEGNHTATVTSSSSGSLTLNSNYNTLAYTKIGRLVTVTGLLIASSVSSGTGYTKISLPFAVSSAHTGRTASATLFNGSSANVRDFVAFTVTGESFLRVYLGDATTAQSDSFNTISASSTDMYVNLTYTTD